MPILEKHAIQHKINTQIKKKKHFKPCINICLQKSSHKMAVPTDSISVIGSKPKNMFNNTKKLVYFFANFPKSRTFALCFS